MSTAVHADGQDRAASRRLAGAIGASAVLHAAVALAVVLRGSEPLPPAPPVYRVDLVAAPPGLPQPGAVGAEPPPVGAPSAVPAEPPPEIAPPKPVAAAPAPKAVPPKAAPTAPKPTPAKAVPAPPAKVTPPPVLARPVKPAPPKVAGATAKAGDAAGKAGAKGQVGPRAGSREGGPGADVANVHTPGLDFEYPGYLQNIVRVVRQRFNPPNAALALSADVSFLIHRDGSVTDVRIVRRSGNYAFDLEARGAIESAGSAGAFGPLPQGFRADVLPVSFSFDPRVLR